MAPGAFVVAITFFIILDLNDFENAKVRKKVIEFIEIFYLCKLKIVDAMTFKEILRKLNNRYIYATLAFLVVILFIDQFNLFEQAKLKRSLKDQKQQIEYYKKELSESKQYLNALQKDSLRNQLKLRSV